MAFTSSNRLIVDSSEWKSMLETTTKLLISYLFDGQSKDLLRLSLNHIDVAETDQYPRVDSEISDDIEATAPLNRVLEKIFDLSLHGTNPRNPNFFALMPNGGLLQSALGDLIGKCINKYTAYYPASPKLIDLEISVIKWLCQELGFTNSEAFGVLTSGGSMSTFSAMCLARDKLLLPNAYHKGCVYWGQGAHFICEKSCRLAGVAQQTRIIPQRLSNQDKNSAFTIDTRCLEEQINKDKADCLIPFMIIATIGSTETGSCDDLLTLHALAKKYNCWLHVDGAYGAMFRLTENISSHSFYQQLSNLHLCDSVTADLHKSFFLPYGTGFLAVKDRKYLKKTFSHDNVPYLIPRENDDSAVDFAELGLEQTREFRGLRLWLPLKLIGVKPFKVCLEERIQMANWLYQELRKVDGIVMVSEPVISIFCFRFIPEKIRTLYPNHDPRTAYNDSKIESELKDLNAKLLDIIRSFHRTVLFPTKLFLAVNDGNNENYKRSEVPIFVIRVIVMSYLTEQINVEHCFEDIQKSVEIMKKSMVYGNEQSRALARN